MNYSMADFPVLHQLLELAQTPVHPVGDATQPPQPVVLFSSCLQSFQHQSLFQWVSSSHQVAKVLEFQLQHQFFQWTPRTDLLWMDWLDLLAVQGTLKSLLQHHSSKASVLGRSAFFMVQLSHPHMTTGKTLALKTWQYQGLTRMWSNWHFHELLAEMQNHMATLENHLEVSYKVKYTLSTWSHNPAPRCHPSKMKVMFTQNLQLAVLFSNQQTIQVN